MPDLREKLRELLQCRACLVGLGNVAYGDDGFGVRMVEELGKAETRRPKAERRPNSEGRNHTSESSCSDFGLRPSFGFRISDFGLRHAVLVAGTTPERVVSQLADEGYDNIIFLDAVDFGGTPGSVVLLDSGEMATRFPQVSTHRLSLGLLAKQLEANGRSKAWLLGVQAQSLKPGEPLSPAVQVTLELLLVLLKEISPVGRAENRHIKRISCQGEAVRAAWVNPGRGDLFIESRPQNVSQTPSGVTCGSLLLPFHAEEINRSPLTGFGDEMERATYYKQDTPNGVVGEPAERSKDACEVQAEDCPRSREVLA